MEKGLENLIEAARKEDWDYVDETIPKISGDRIYIDWAIKEGIDDNNGNVRDLAVSILGKTKLNDKDLKEIETKFHRCLYDSNTYVRYRTVFALMEQKSGVYGRNPLIVKTLKEAEKDEAVSGIAKGYLQRIKEGKI